MNVLNKFVGWLLIALGASFIISTLFQGGIKITPDAQVNENLKSVNNRTNAVGGLILMGIGASMVLAKGQSS